MKTILITGATDGIGRATAQKMLQENWNVVILGRNPQKVQTTVSELQAQTGKNSISGITADLSIMAEVKKAVATFLENNSRLDILLLNANAIANERIITKEGNEQNFAVGYLSRVLMIQLLQEVLEKTENSQIFSVVGMDYTRLDFEDLTIEKEFTGRKGLTRWQWAINLFLMDYAQKNKVLANIYMPGLVKTKILSNEPQPMRLFVQIMNKIVGITPEKAAKNIFSVLNEITQQNKQGHIFSWKTDKGFPKLKTENGDKEKLLAVTDKLLSPFL